MKTKIFLLLLFISALAAYPQGAVLFANRLTTAGIDAPISYCYDGGPAPAGRVNGSTAIHYESRVFGGLYARAALYGGPAGTSEDLLKQIGPAISFRTTAATAGYFVNTNTTRILTNVPVGGAAVLQVRSWDCGYEINSYEDAISTAEYYAGKGNLINIATLGDTNAPSPLVGMTAYCMNGGLVCWAPVLTIRKTATNTVVLSCPNWCGPYGYYDYFLGVQTNAPGVGLSRADGWSEQLALTNEWTFPIDPNVGSVFYGMRYERKPGMVLFNSKVSSASIDAPISYCGGPVGGTRPNGTNAIPYGSQLFGGIYARAALYGGPAGTAESALVQLGPAVGFRSTPPTAGYLVATNALRIVTNVPVGGAAVVQVRAWDCGCEVDSYENAIGIINAIGCGYYGVSALVNLPMLGTTTNPTPLVGLTSFCIGTLGIESPRP